MDRTSQSPLGLTRLPESFGAHLQESPLRLLLPLPGHRLPVPFDPLEAASAVRPFAVLSQIQPLPESGHTL